MSIPPFAPATFEQKVLPFKTVDSTGAVKFNLSITANQITALAFIIPFIGEALKKDIGLFVIATHEGMNKEFVAFREAQFPNMPLHRNCDLAVLVNRLWKRTREYEKAVIEYTYGPKAVKALDILLYREAEEMAYNIRNEGGQAEVFTKSQAALLASLIPRLMNI